MKKKQQAADSGSKMTAKEFFLKYWYWFVIMLIVLIIGAWAGYAVQDVGKISKILGRPEKYIKEYMTFGSFIKSIVSFFTLEGTAFVGGMTGMVIVFVTFAIVTKPKKRFHRKGVEHGSAKWGGDEEKRIIQDTNDFYNNVIVASDVLLVLDRKKRDMNAVGKGKSKNKDKSEAKKSDAEKKRLQKIRSYINSVLQKSGEEKYIINKDVLVRFTDTQTSYAQIPQEVKAIGKYAFAECAVSEITINKECKVIKKGAFYGCTSLTCVNLANISKIGKLAFEGCENLETVSIGETTKKIGKNAFKNCKRAVIQCPRGSYAEKYADENCIQRENPEVDSGENEKISVDTVLKSAAKSQKIAPMLNLNQIVLGGSGTGKSRFFVKPNLMQCNSSYVITDPSGELLQSCGKMLEKEGYVIKVFNISDMRYSNNYNPFRYLKDSDGNYNENEVIKMINTFMLNTKGEGEGGDPFWDDATKLLLSSLCFLLVETAPEEQQNLSGVLELIHKAHVVEGKEEEKSELDIIFDEHEAESPNALSCQYYTEFKQAAGKTMQSILISTTVRLQCFKLEQVRNLTSSDNIHLEEMGDRKTALFIIISTTDTTYNFLAALMYSQLFDSLYNRAITKYHGRLKYHVRFLLDDFANIGKIPNFDLILATCRKFEISAVVILQNITQLKRIYEKSWEELPGNCDTMVFLGGKDQFTNEYLMKSLGKETIDLVSVNKSKGQSGSTSFNDSILGRELMQLNELETMDNSKCIVMVRGLNPFFTDKFELKNHRRYKMLDEAWNYETMGAVNRNQYLIEENMRTVPETKIIDLSEWIDDEETLGIDTESINIMYVTPDNERFYTAEEIKAEEGLRAASDILGNVMGADIFSSVTIS